METAPVRIWSGVHEALQLYAADKKWDMSALASFELMRAMFAEEDVPEKAQQALVRAFFEVLGEGLIANREELASWVMGLMKQAKKAK